MYVLEESAVSEHVHCALIFKENPVWIKASGVIIHVVRDLVKSCASRELRVVVIFVVKLRVLFYISVALVCFVAVMHN